MELEGKALYNLLRMNWAENPDMDVEPWQVEDLRKVSDSTLFGRLSSFGFNFDHQSFSAIGEEVDSPEALTDLLIGDKELDPKEQDQIYLLVFELWRRFLPEKASISIFCDELDTQIFHYDQGTATSLEALQDALSNLKVILDENTDHGANPVETFETIGSLCANDLDSFLYDFAADQIDLENESYASELMDDFYDYMPDTIWFDLLKARLLSYQDEEASHQKLLEILEEFEENPSLDFVMELLAFCAQGSDPEVFIKVLLLALQLIETETDFVEVLHLSEDFCDYFNFDSEQKEIHALIEKRSEVPSDDRFQKNDPMVANLLKILYQATGFAKQ